MTVRVMLSLAKGPPKYVSTSALRITTSDTITEVCRPHVSQFWTVAERVVWDVFNIAVNHNSDRSGRVKSIVRRKDATLTPRVLQRRRFLARDLPARQRNERDEAQAIQLLHCRKKIRTNAVDFECADSTSRSSTAR